MKRLLLYLLPLLILAIGCDKNPSGTESAKTVRSVGAFIINEGNFGKGNGSLSFYSYQDETVQNNIFKSVNNRDLGDTPNSMTLCKDYGFIVVNNSNKIEIINLKDWKSVKTLVLDGGPSPRNLAVVSDHKAYVTNLYANNVIIIDLDSLKVTGKTIAVGNNPDEIVVVGGKAFVVNTGFGYGNTVSVIDVATDQVVKTIKVGDNPTSLMVDDDQEVNVLCTGQWPSWTDTTQKGTNGSLFVIDAANMTVVDSLGITGHPMDITYAGNDVGFFILNGTVVKFSTETNKILNAQFISGFFYGVEADPVDQKLFVLDAKDYQSNGELRIYDMEGNLQKQFTVGIIPGAVTFAYE